MRIPAWQILLILVVFPVLYILNNFTPWSEGLWNNGDRDYYIPFWSSIFILHWISALLCLFFISKAGYGIRDLGYSLSLKKTGIALGAYFIIGLVMLALTEILTQYQPLSISPSMDDFYPITLTERAVWMVMALTAGICEEFVYRGFGITALKGKNLPTWLIVILTTLSFIFIHGVAGYYMFPFYAIFGTLMALLFIWRKSIVPNIIVHALFDLSAMMAVLGKF